MEAFPEDYVSHNVPLILLFGIGQEKPSSHRKDNGRDQLQEGGFRIRRDSPNLTNDAAESVLQAFASFDSTGGIIYSPKDGPGPFKIKTVMGRVGQSP